MTYFMYVDESGDPGIADPNAPPDRRPSAHYILSGLIIPITEWRNYLSAIVDIRRYIKRKYGIPVREELKGATLVNPRGNPYLRKLSRRQRVDIYQYIFDQMVSRMNRIKIINIYCDKEKYYYQNTQNTDLEFEAWKRLIQRFDNFLSKQEELCYGVVLADQTNEIKLRKILRKMRVFNPIPSRYGGYYYKPTERIVEDPIMRDSKHSFFIQLCDLVAHALYRKEHPKGAYRKYNVDRLFDKVCPLLLTEASRSDRLGIVRL